MYGLFCSIIWVADAGAEEAGILYYFTIFKFKILCVAEYPAIRSPAIC